MKKQILYIFLSALLLIGAFQNCSGDMDAMNPESLTNTKNLPSEQPSKLIVSLGMNLENTNTLSTPLTIISGEQVFLSINLDTGQATASNSGQNYCLPHDLLELANNYINSSEFCHDNPPEGVMCTMVYKYPYAGLEFDNEVVDLGRSSNGCSDGFDLCDDENRRQFRQFVNEIKSDFEAFSCD